MGLRLSSLSTERQWRSSTGLSESEFKRLGHWFGTAYKTAQGVGIDEAQAQLKMEFVFGTYAELLFFTLFSLKNTTAFDVNGLIFGISQTAAEYNFRKGLELLRIALGPCGQLPPQDFKDLADFESYVREHDCLKIDVTEVAIEHSIGQMKVCRSIHQVVRLKGNALLDTMVLVAAGLANFKKAPNQLIINLIHCYSSFHLKMCTLSNLGSSHRSTVGLAAFFQKNFSTGSVPPQPIVLLPMFGKAAPRVI